MINLNINNLKSDLVGDVLPNIFFNKVVLDSKDEPIPEFNPHIDVAREGISLQTGKGKRIFHNGFNTNKNNVENKNLITKINLTVFNSIDKATDDSWFKNVDLLDFIYVRLIQSTSEKFTNNFTQLGYPTDLKSVADNDKIKVLTIPLKDINKQVLTNLQTDLKFVQEIHHETQFSIKGLNQDHLTLFANCYLDLDEFINKFQLNLPNNLEIKGNTTVENVVKSNQVNNDSYVYAASDGSIYTGKVTKSNNNFFTSNLVSPKKLTKINVTNLKVKDRRKIKNTIDVKTNVKSLLNKVKTKQINKSQVISELFLSKNDLNVLTSYTFVDVLEALKENTKYDFIFKNENELILSEALSYIKIKRISFFRKRVFDNNSLFNKEQNKLVISSTESRSGTVKNTLSFYTKYKNFLTFDSEQIQSKNFASTLPSSETLDSLFKVGEIKEIVLKNTEYLRCFTFIDYEMSKITDGKYQYTIEIEIEDKTKDFLLNYYNNLITTKNELISYYNNVMINYNNNSDSLNEAYIAQLLSKYPASIAGNFSITNTTTATWISAPSVYFSSLNVLEATEPLPYEIENFYKFLHPRTTSPDEINYVINLFDSLIGKYEQILDFKNDLGQKNIQNFENKNLLISKTFKNVFDSNDKKNITMDFIGSKLQNNKVKLSTFSDRIKKEKRKYFSSDTLQPDLELSQSLNNPQSYTDLYDIDTVSTAFLTPAVIKTQINNFNLIDSGENLWNPEQYNLVNSQALNNKNKRNRPFVSNTNNFASTLSNTLVNDIGITIEDQNTLALPNVKQIQFVPSDKDVSSWLGTSSPFKNTNLLEKDESCEDVKEKTNFSINLVEVDALLKSLESTETKTKQYSIKNFDLKSNTQVINKIVNKKINLSNQTNKLNTNDFDLLQRKTKAITAKINPSNFENVNVRSTVMPQISSTTSFTKTMPIQLKAFMLGSNKSVKKNFFELEFDPLQHPETKNIIKYNFQTIIKLEYLSGFELSNGKVNLNKPIWSLLTKNIFDNFNGELLIKQSRFDDKTVEIVGTDDDITIENKYFILDSEKTDAPTTSMVQETLEAQRASLITNKNIISAGAVSQVVDNLNLKKTFQNQIKKNLLVKNVSDLSIEPKFIRTFEV